LSVCRGECVAVWRKWNMSWFVCVRSRSTPEYDPAKKKNRRLTVETVRSVSNSRHEKHSVRGTVIMIRTVVTPARISSLISSFFKVLLVARNARVCNFLYQPIMSHFCEFCILLKS
jgi:hypothetical protein